MSNVDEHGRVSNKVGTEVEYSHSDIVMMRNVKTENKTNGYYDLDK